MQDVHNLHELLATSLQEQLQHFTLVEDGGLHTHSSWQS